MPTSVTRNAPRSAFLRSRQVRTMADRMLRYLKRQDAELSILLTHDGLMQELNREHRGKDRPTDVLAFSQLESQADFAEAPLPPGDLLLLGDVVISVDTAEKQARHRGHSLHEEVCFLLAHGILHLVGYDHQNDEQEREMNEMARCLVRSATSRGPRSRSRAPERQPASLSQSEG